jgi:hypothetical protein
MICTGISAKSTLRSGPGWRNRSGEQVDFSAVSLFGVLQNRLAEPQVTT